MFHAYLSVAELRDLLLRLLAVSATLAGFCVAGIGLLNAQAKTQRYVGLEDDVLVLAALMFLACTYLTFWALRTTLESRLILLTRIIDVLFLVGLTLVVISGIGIAYAIF